MLAGLPGPSCRAMYHHPVGHRPQTAPVLLETFGKPRLLVHPTRSLYLRPAKMEECDFLCAPSAPKCPATLSHLKQIPVRILEPRGVTPGELKDLGWLEVHSARLQRLERHPAILHLDGINRGTPLGPAGCAWPQNELEVLPLDADGQESRSSVGCWVVTPFLETDDIRVEVERLVLIAHQQRHVHHFFQHRRCSFRIIASANIKPEQRKDERNDVQRFSLFTFTISKGRHPAAHRRDVKR